MLYLIVLINVGNAFLLRDVFVVVVWPYHIVWMIFRVWGLDSYGFYKFHRGLKFYCLTLYLPHIHTPLLHTHTTHTPPINGHTTHASVTHSQTTHSHTTHHSHTFHTPTHSSLTPSHSLDHSHPHTQSPTTSLRSI